MVTDLLARVIHLFAEAVAAGDYEQAELWARTALTLAAYETPRVEAER